MATGRQGDVATIFHPANAADELRHVCEPILLLSQLGSVAIVMGGFLSRMRRDEAQLESIASMMIKVAFIASVPLWQSLVMEISDAVADSLGQRALPTSSLATDATADRKAISPLMQRVADLERHWKLDTSPVLDSLGDRQAVQSGKEEEWLAKGWNWARSSHIAAGSDAEEQWSIAMDASRAGLVHRAILGVGFCVQMNQIAFYLAEMLRLLLFHAGFSLLPLFVAGLGSASLHTPSLRALLGVAGVSLWPVGWAVANVGTASMLDPALDILGKCAGSAMYPQVAEGTTRTIALAAPYLSWSLLSLLSAITLALCL
ncbi:MAG: hypothetical protein WC378_15760, partial [Opitutaceae bacterium]